jgi:putative membrane protein
MRACALLHEKRMNDSSDPRVHTDLAARRTGMSFQRTRMAADRTLMSVIRTALALITFGFTFAKMFQHLVEAQLFEHHLAPHRFGASLLALGVLMLVFGIGYHLVFMYQLRKLRSRMKAEGSIHAESVYPISLVLIVAVLLLVIGVFAVTSTFFAIGPFSA